jgi:hypothetical protein
MRSLTVMLPAVLVLAVPAPALGAESARGQIIVGFRSGTAHARVDALVQKAGGRVARRLDRIGAAVVKPRTGRDTSALRTRLRRVHAVRYAEPDFILAKSVTPDDPSYNVQYALGSSSDGISAPTAWGQHTSCSLVGELDTGVQYNHPDLTGNVWHNPHEIAGNNVDDDHNGYVDDYYGVNIEKGRDSGSDGDGHGTHVAGIMAGHGNNATGISGECWSAQVMPIRFMNDQGKGTTSDAIAGIDYAIHMHAKIVNCSFGSSASSSALQDAVTSAQDAGVLLVVAAGNDSQSIDSTPEYPAAYTNGNILTVAATDSAGNLASFSNYGAKSVDVGAPGDNIYSTYLTSTYKYLSGTSMASPMVAAAAAMLHAHFTKLTYSQIRSTLKASVDPDPALQGKTVTGGRLDLAKALTQAAG